MFEEEIEGICGPSYGRGAENDCYRAGSAPSSVMSQGGREPMQKPRVRHRRADGRSDEVTLES
ncbi:MAG: hypothetical protein ACLFUF_06340 [Opitutales bacterium]